MNIENKLKKKILIVDDNKLAVAILKEFLSCRLGFKNVEVTHDFKSALISIQNEKPYAFFPDTQIGNDLGYKQISKIKNQLNGIIVFPMSNEKEYEKNWKKIRINNFIYKPDFIEKPEIVKSYIYKKMSFEV